MGNLALKYSTAGLFVGALALFGFYGCADNTEPGSVKDADTLTINLRDEVVHATLVSPSQVHVDIFARDGVKELAVDYTQVSDERSDSIRWTRYERAVDGQPSAPTSSGSLALPFEHLPDLEGAVNAALYLRAAVAKALHGTEYNNWGCDLLPAEHASKRRTGSVAAASCSGPVWS